MTRHFSHNLETMLLPVTVLRHKIFHHSMLNRRYTRYCWMLIRESTPASHHHALTPSRLQQTMMKKRKWDRQTEREREKERERKRGTVF